ncbi:MAG: hypothetical protein EOM52_09660 [Clostridia bacterium]|nr:hypothetical protein [Clostridia bacterium]
MHGKNSAQETFVVTVMNTQNDTWQGTVTWTDGHKSEPFRSALELMQLIGSALKSEDHTIPEQDGP